MKRSKNAPSSSDIRSRAKLISIAVPTSIMAVALCESLLATGLPAGLRQHLGSRARIDLYLGFYNSRWLHSSLDGKTPDQAYFNQSMTKRRARNLFRQTEPPLRKDHSEDGA